MPYPALAATLATLFAAQAQSPGLSAYLDLTEATLADPVDHAELRSLALSPEGIQAITALFDRSIDEAIEIDGEWVSPELGGEAMVDAGRVSFVIYPDPVHPVVRELLARRSEPATMLSYLEGFDTGRYLLETTGGLHALLYQLVNEPVTPERQRLLEDVLRSTVATHFKTWTTDPAIQADQIERVEWRGRYLGFWHAHPPRRNDNGFLVGIEPSVADMRNAVELGQFLTIVFQPGGFDLYDLSAVARAGRIDRSQLQVIRHRDPAWREHFEARFQAQPAAPREPRPRQGADVRWRDSCTAPAPHIASRPVTSSVDGSTFRNGCGLTSTR